ncbi:hypothetical protein KP509_14G069000 [Ceratopteris richardii]|uniref:NAD(+) kinase n=1 Tax=Ceratopteris richardii TaxID=49495 RepID=A0A8T2TCR9_CERRI|nr:hypothetical protein KP509_14G069000 [Ceratopteris richardii]
MQRVLLFLKRTSLDLPLDDAPYSVRRIANHFHERDTVHEVTIRRCKEVLDKRGLTWKSLYLDELKEAIRDVDLVVTVGGDGTFLRASHYVGSTIPILGVNSDPTRATELATNTEFDATRSAGYLCAAVKDSFDQVLGEIFEGKRQPVLVHRIETRVNTSPLQTYALNDVLLAHPSPASVTRCTFRIYKKQNSEPVSPYIHTRSSGLRICTGVGSTAAMRSAGGYTMAPTSTELQYMVREPIITEPSQQSFMHRIIQEDEMLEVRYTGRQGAIYIDGMYVCQNVEFGDAIKFSTNAPKLQMFLKNPGTA